MIPLEAETKFSNPSELRLHVYVVGYNPEGESILTLIAEGDKALYVMVTDCYEKAFDDNNNQKTTFSKIQEILKLWGDPPINIFIWTHPHQDHSIGIPRLLDLCDPEHKAFVLVPVNLVGFKDHPEVKPCAQEAHDWINKNYEKSGHLIFIGCHILEPICQVPVIIRSGSPDLFPHLSFHLNFFCPYQHHVSHQADLSYFNLNVASLAYILSVNGIDVFMGGDLNSKVLRDIDNSVFTHINLIKIPHHASSEAKDLIPKFKQNTCPNVYSVSTIFKKGDDPKPGILQDYLRLPSIVHCTGPESSYAGNEIFGMIEYEFNIFSSTFEKLTPSGHTYKVS